MKLLLENFFDAHDKYNTKVNLKVGS